MFIAPAVVIMAGVLAPAVAHTDHFVGRWDGAIALPDGQSIALSVMINTGADGKLAAMLDVPSQGAAGLPLSDLVVADHALSFNLAMAGGRFEGKMTDEDTVTGVWSQGGATLPLVLKRAKG